MPDIPTLTLDTAEGAAKDVLEKTQAAYGFIPNLIGKMANAPALAEAYLTLNGLLDQTSFSATEKQLVLLTISRTHECGYCMAAHSTIAQMQNVPKDVIDAIRDDATLPDNKLETLRQLTIAITTSRGWPNEKNIQSFFAAGYDASNILEIILAVGLKTMSNYTNHIAHTDVDEAFSANAWQVK
ncbi:MAG: carboxymuconolactone decarboxylase family protein [Mariprofundaceae bacterium]